MTLSYAPTADAPRQLTLELNPSSVRLIFPPPSAVVYLVVLAGTLGLLLTLLIAFATVIWLVRPIGRIPLHLIIIPFAFLGSIIFFSIMSARDLWKKYRFCPREIFSIAFDEAALIREHVTWRRRRIREWSLGQVRSVSCDLFRFPGLRAGAVLQIRIRRRPSVVRTVHGERDIQLAREFVERFQTALATSRE